MAYFPDPQRDTYLPVLLRSTSLTTAKAFSAETVDPIKRETIFLNTLAVLSVREYLSILGLETNVAQGDSWQPSLRLIDNPADLYLVERGYLECIPTQADANTVLVSPEVQLRRLAYIIVELQEPFKEARLIGFGKLSEIVQSTLSKTELHPISELPQYLSQFHHSRIGQWFQDHAESIWQQPENVVATRYPAFRFRSQSGPILRKARSISFQTDIGSPLKLGLVIAAKPSEESICISAQLHPGVSETSASSINPTLPPGASITLLSDELETIQSISARSVPQDTFIQLRPFECSPEDQYQIRVSLGEQRVIEILSF